MESTCIIKDELCVLKVARIDWKLRKDREKPKKYLSMTPPSSLSDGSFNITLVNDQRNF